jgi:PTS system nitrogen regulatory IIA component
MRLRDFLRDDFVLLRLGAREIDGVFREIGLLAERSGIAPSKRIEASLLERERHCSTVLGGGLAVPHAQIPDLEAPVIGVALVGGPPVLAPGSDPVRVFFVVLTPPGLERVHLQILSRICRLMLREGFIARLESAADPTEVCGVIEEGDDLAR